MSERQRSVKRKSHVWLPSKRQNVPVGCCASAVLPGGNLLPDLAPSVSLLKRTQPTCFNEEYWQSAGREETMFILSVAPFGLASFMHV